MKNENDLTKYVGILCQAHSNAFIFKRTTLLGD